MSGLFDLGRKNGEELVDGVIEFGEVGDCVAEVSDGLRCLLGAGHGLIIGDCAGLSNLIRMGGDRFGRGVEASGARG